MQNRLLSLALVSALLCLLLAPLAFSSSSDTPSSGSSSTSTAAVPLFRPHPASPTESAGSGEAPRVSVTLHVSETGRVTRVDVNRVEPSGKHDAAFARSAQRTLESWRFAPALEDGVPVATELSWTIAFASLGKSAGISVVGSKGMTALPPTRIVSLDEVSRPKGLSMREMRKLSAAQQREYARAHFDRAEALLDRSARTEFESARFIVVTDAPGENLAQILAANFEATYAAVYSVFESKMSAYPNFGKLRVYVFTTRKQFHEFFSDVRAAGVYISAGVLAFHLELPTDAEILTVQIHETVHALIDRHLIAPGVTIPVWLNEGVAEYFGNSDIEKGRLIPGKRGPRSQAVMTRDGSVVDVPVHGTLSARALAQARATGKLIPLQELLAASAEVFYGDESGLYYAQSWRFVHFLRHSDDLPKGAFETFMLFVTEGYDVHTAFVAAFRTTPAALEPAFQAYLKQS